MVKTKVVNINDEPYDVFIGRPSLWGNPYKIGRDGTRSEVLVKYYWYIKGNDYFMRKTYELKGKVLGCYCKPKPCHGDVLVKLIEEMDVEKFMKEK